MSDAPHVDSDSPTALQARKRLNRVWFAFLLTAFVGMAAMFGALQYQWEAAQLKGWFLVTALALFYELRIFKQALPLMHPPEEVTLSQNIHRNMTLTLVAGLGYGLLAGLLMVPQPAGVLGWLAPVLAVVALLVDAWGAQRDKQGDDQVGNRYLAQEFRALGALVITVVAIHYGKLPSWFLVVGFLEYLILFTASWMVRQGRKVPTVDARGRTNFLWIYLGIVGTGMAPIFHDQVATPMGMMTGIVYGLMAVRDWLRLVEDDQERAS